MPLFKKNYIHEGNAIVHIGPQGVLSNTENIDYNPGISEEEQAQSILQQAENTLKKAYADAEKIKQQAYQDIEQAREKARQEGYESGKQDSLNQLRKNLEEVNKIIQQATREKVKIINSSEPELLKLAVKVARVVIKKELEVDQDIVMKILEEAIEKISDNQQVVIRVSHQDLQTVRNNKDKIIDLVEAKNLSIVADKHIEDGGCMIETKLGYIDARIETKLELIEQALLGVYEEDRVKKEAAKEKEIENAVPQQDNTVAGAPVDNFTDIPAQSQDNLINAELPENNPENANFKQMDDFDDDLLDDNFDSSEAKGL